jgi:hypothetical protein
MTSAIENGLAPDGHAQMMGAALNVECQLACELPSRVDGFDGHGMSPSSPAGCNAFIS